MELILPIRRLVFFLKGHVRAHQRRLEGGKIAQVGSYFNKRLKKIQSVGTLTRRKVDELHGRWARGETKDDAAKRMYDDLHEHERELEGKIWQHGGAKESIPTKERQGLREAHKHVVRRKEAVGEMLEHHVRYEGRQEDKKNEQEEQRKARERQKAKKRHPKQEPSSSAKRKAIEELDSDKHRHSISSSPVVSKSAMDCGSANATFKVTMKDGTKVLWKPEGGERHDLRDGIKNGMFRREVAVSEIAQIIGMGKFVPKTAYRTIGGEVGSAMTWVENAETARVAGSGRMYDGKENAILCAAFDFLIGNSDRHAKNWMIDGDDNIHLIDNGLSLPVHNNDWKHWCNKQIFDHVAGDEEEVPDVVADWVDRWDDIKAVCVRNHIEPVAINAMRVRLDLIVAANAGDETFDALLTEYRQSDADADTAIPNEKVKTEARSLAGDERSGKATKYQTGHHEEPEPTPESTPKTGIETREDREAQNWTDGLPPAQEGQEPLKQALVKEFQRAVPEFKETEENLNQKDHQGNTAEIKQTGLSYKGLFVHPTLIKTGRSERGHWSVTHIHSGLAAHTAFKTKEQAMFYAWRFAQVGDMNQSKEQIYKYKNFHVLGAGMRRDLYIDVNAAKSLPPLYLHGTKGTFIRSGSKDHREKFAQDRKAAREHSGGTLTPEARAKDKEDFKKEAGDVSWDSALTSTQQNVAKVAKFQQEVMGDSDKLKAKAEAELDTVQQNIRKSQTYLQGRIDKNERRDKQFDTAQQEYFRLLGHRKLLQRTIALCEEASTSGHLMSGKVGNE
jgi:hypothetical protein